MLLDKIKEICKTKGRSISSVEKEAGLGNGTISGWKESMPRIDNLKAVASVLQVPIETLLVEGGE